MIPSQAENDFHTKPYEYCNPANHDAYGYSLACSLGFGSSSSIIVNIRGLTFTEEAPGLKKDP